MYNKQKEVNTHDNKEMRGDKIPTIRGKGENTPFAYKVSKRSGTMTMVTTQIMEEHISSRRYIPGSRNTALQQDHDLRYSQSWKNPKYQLDFSFQACSNIIFIHETVQLFRLSLYVRTWWSVFLTSCMVSVCQSSTDSWLIKRGPGFDWLTPGKNCGTLSFLKFDRKWRSKLRKIIVLKNFWT